MPVTQEQPLTPVHDRLIHPHMVHHARPLLLLAWYHVLETTARHALVNGMGTLGIMAPLNAVIRSIYGG
jgi:hypothetical protein